MPLSKTTFRHFLFLNSCSIYIVDPYSLFTGVGPKSAGETIKWTKSSGENAYVQWPVEQKRHSFYNFCDAIMSSFKTICHNICASLFFALLPRRADPAGLGQHGGTRTEQLQQRRGSHGGHYELAGDGCEHGSNRGLWELALALLAARTDSLSSHDALAEDSTVLLFALWPTEPALRSWNHWACSKGRNTSYLGEPWLSTAERSNPFALPAPEVGRSIGLLPCAVLLEKLLKPFDICQNLPGDDLHVSQEMLLFYFLNVLSRRRRLKPSSHFPLPN